MSNIKITQLPELAPTPLSGSDVFPVVSSNVTYQVTANAIATFVGGGGANTGNVTFNDITIQGTGDEYGGSGLYLAPGANSTGNLQYLRVRGGDFPTHIHFDTGNNAYFDQYFGADDKYVKLEANGNVVINANDLVGNAATWNFDIGGNVTLPRGGNINWGTTAFIQSYENESIQMVTPGLTGNGFVLVEQRDNNWFSSSQDDLTGPNQALAMIKTELGTSETPTVYIYTQKASDGIQKAWTFDSNGNLNVPQGGYIGAAGVKGDGTMLTGGTGNIASLTSFYADAPGIYAGCFTANPDGSLNISTYGNGTGLAGQWTFANDILTLPGEGVLRSISDSVTLQTINTVSGNANSVYLGTSGGLGFSDQEIGGNWLEIFRNGTEPEIRVPVGRGNLNLQTAEGNTAYNWTLDNTGNLTLPGNTFAVNYANGTPVSISGGSSVAEAPFTIITNDFTATAGSRYGVDTTGGGWIATLPASPTSGQAVFFADAGGAYSTNPFIVNPGVNTIMGVGGSMTVTTNGQSFGLFWNGTTWRTYS